MARNLRETLSTDVWDNMKRVRSAVKGIYGDNSNEYEKEVQFMPGFAKHSEGDKPALHPSPF